MLKVRGYHVVGVVDVNQAAARALAADMPAGTISGTNVLPTMIEARAEAVVIATAPDSGRAQQVYDALDAGAVLVRVEKPVATTYTESLEVQRLVEDAGAIGVVGHTPLHCPSARAFRATVAAMKSDVVLHTVRIGTRAAVCNPLLDLGVHDFAMAHYALGGVEITAAAVLENGDYEVHGVGGNGARLVARIGVNAARAERTAWVEHVSHPGARIVTYDEATQVVSAGNERAHKASTDPLGVELAKHVAGGGTPITVGVAAVRMAVTAQMQLEGRQICV
jgi:predicted dehydrogenase